MSPYRIAFGTVGIDTSSCESLISAENSPDLSGASSHIGATGSGSSGGTTGCHQDSKSEDRLSVDSWSVTGSLPSSPRKSLLSVVSIIYILFQHQ